MHHYTLSLPQPVDRKVRHDFAKAKEIEKKRIEVSDQYLARFICAMRSFYLFSLSFLSDGYYDIGSLEEFKFKNAKNPTSSTAEQDTVFPTTRMISWHHERNIVAVTVDALRIEEECERSGTGISRHVLLFNVSKSAQLYQSEIATGHQEKEKEKEKKISSKDEYNEDDAHGLLYHSRHYFGIFAIEWRPLSDELYCGVLGGICIWNIKPQNTSTLSKSSSSSMTFLPHPRSPVALIDCIQFSPSGRFFLSSVQGENKIYLWDANLGSSTAIYCVGLSSLPFNPLNWDSEEYVSIKLRSNDLLILDPNSWANFPVCQNNFRVTSQCWAGANILLFAYEDSPNIYYANIKEESFDRKAFTFTYPLDISHAPFSISTDIAMSKWKSVCDGMIDQTVSIENLSNIASDPSGKYLAVFFQETSLRDGPAVNFPVVAVYVISAKSYELNLTLCRHIFVKTDGRLARPQCMQFKQRPYSALRSRHSEALCSLVVSWDNGNLTFDDFL